MTPITTEQTYFVYYKRPFCSPYPAKVYDELRNHKGKPAGPEVVARRKLRPDEIHLSIEELCSLYPCP